MQAFELPPEFWSQIWVEISLNLEFFSEQYFSWLPHSRKSFHFMGTSRTFNSKRFNENIGSHLPQDVFASFCLELSAAFPLFSFQLLHFYFKTFFSWNWIFQAKFSIFKVHLSPSQLPSPGNILFSLQLCLGSTHTILTARSSLKFVFPTQRKTFSSD